MKKKIYKIFLLIERIKISFLYKILGSSYLVRTIFLCKNDNIIKILNKYGAKIQNKTTIKSMLNIDNYGCKGLEFSNIFIGKNCYIGKNVFLDLANKIIIEDDVVISAGVSIITHGDVGDRKMKKYVRRISKPVKIGMASWIGANSTILPGVTIGKFCIVAAGSVVIDDVPDYTLVAGIPAKIKKVIK